MGCRTLLTGLMAAAFWMPGPGLAENKGADPLPESEDGYVGLEDLQLRSKIAGLHRYYSFEDEDGTPETASAGQELQPVGMDGGSAGGYVTFGGPGTSTFLGSMRESGDALLASPLQFGFDWHADVREADVGDYRRLGRSLSGGDIDRIGVRADLTALLHGESVGDETSTAWRVTGMLGSTSLSLASDGGTSPWTGGAGGFLWDVGVGWSSGSMSVNAGYQSAYSGDEGDENRSAITVLSLGADYAVLPGLSVFGELNMIDSALDESSAEFGAVVVVGTGVSF